MWKNCWNSRQGNQIRVWLKFKPNWISSKFLITFYRYRMPFPMCRCSLLMFNMGLMVAKLLSMNHQKSCWKILDIANGFITYAHQRRFLENIYIKDATTKKGFRETQRSAAKESDGNCNSNNSLLTHWHVF